MYVLLFNQRRAHRRKHFGARELTSSSYRVQCTLLHGPNHARPSAAIVVIEARTSARGMEGSVNCLMTRSGRPTRIDSAFFLFL